MLYNFYKSYRYNYFYKGIAIMKIFTIDLYDYFKISKPENGAGYLTAYILDDHDGHERRFRPAMVVIPGGGYAWRSDREREPIALKFLERGFNAFTLAYSTHPVSYPYQLIEGAMAIAYIRENYIDLGVDRDHVGAIGFSAGGHLCAMLATLTDDQVIKDALKDKAGLCTPNAVVLSYPVICADEKIAHLGSIEKISGGNNELKAKLSLETRVTKSSVPAFIWATANDGSVPSENSLEMAFAYKRAGVPFELHVFEDGQHGLACCDEETFFVNNEAKEWIKLCMNWLKKRGFSIKGE